MRGRKAAWLAWIWSGAMSILVLWDIGATISDHTAYDNVFALLDPMLWSLGGGVFALVGALIVSRQPRNSIGWLVMVPSLLKVADTLSTRYPGTPEIAPAEPSAFFLLAIWLIGISWMPMIFSVLFLLQLFPTGRPLSPRWRWGIAAGLGMGVFFSAWTGFEAEWSLGESVTVSNPIGFLSPDSFPMGIWLVALVLLTLASGASLFLRYRRANPIEREQIKWLLYACGLFVAVFIPGVWLSDAPPPAVDIWGDAFALSLTAIPAAIAIAILRYRLWDIDVIIRRTLVYAVMTALLALVYLGSVIILQLTLGSVIGEHSPLVIVLSTLIIAALFSTLRRRVQQLIDRRFYRQRYDAVRVLAELGESLKSAGGSEENGIEQLSGRIVAVVQETMQPEHVGLWLKPAAETVKRGQG